MQVRRFNREIDMDEYSRWCQEQNYHILSEKGMSPIGFIAEDKDNKLACVFVYSMPGIIYFLESCVGNPSVDWEQREKGIKKVLEIASEWSKQDGAEYVFLLTKHSRLQEKIKDLGFVKGLDDLTMYVRSL